MPRHRLSLGTSALMLAAGLAGSPALAQNCTVHFTPVLEFEQLDNGVEGLYVVDLGNGPELMIGGSFNTIAGLPFNKVARFNGSAYTPLGQGLHPYVENFIGCCSKGFSFARFDDGAGTALIVGGDYVAVWDSTEPMFSISRWRPATGAWESLGGLLNADNCVADCPPRVHDVQVFDTPGGPALAIAGTFSVLGAFGPAPAESKYVGLLTATGWAGMDGGMSVVRPENPEPAVVFALELFDDGQGERLYAAGHFTNAGSVRADCIARWNGTTWEALPGGGIGPNGDEPPFGQINAMTVFNGSLIVGGEFTDAGGVHVSHIARWDGAQWHALGSGVDAQVRALAVWDDGSGPALYVGGEFTTAGGRAAQHIARWDGTDWEPVLDGLDSSPYTMTVYEGELYIGGFFTGSGDVIAPNLIRLTNLPCCPPDFNGDTLVTVQDIFDYLAAYFSATDERADFNRDGNISVQDIFDFLAAYFSGCA